MLSNKPFDQIPFNPARWPFFYGWMILFWGVIGVLLSVPGQTTGVSAFIEPLIHTLGISRLQISGAYMFGTLFSSLLLTPAGKLFDRIGARWMAAGSCAALGIVLFLLSQTANLAGILSHLIPEQMAIVGLLGLLFFMLRLSGQGILTMSSRNMVMKWFDHHRGLVSGISGAAIAFGFSYAPILFSNMIRMYDWFGTWRLLSLFLILVFSPLLLIFFRDNPEACELVPDGKPRNSKTKETVELTQFTLPAARRTFSFWAFTLSIALQALVLTAVTFHIESIFELAGMDGSKGFSIFPPMALISVIITLIGGWLSDRIELRWFLSTMLIGMSANLFALTSLAPGWPIALMILGGGISNGLFGILMSVTWPRYYGREHLGAISGFCMTFIVIFSSIGPAFYSAVHLISGNYKGGNLIALVAALVLFIYSFRARNPQIWEEEN